MKMRTTLYASGKRMVQRGKEQWSSTKGCVGTGMSRAGSGGSAMIIITTTTTCKTRTVTSKPCQYVQTTSKKSHMMTNKSKRKKLIQKAIDKIRYSACWRIRSAWRVKFPDIVTRHNRPWTVSLRDNRPKKGGDYVLITGDYIQNITPPPQKKKKNCAIIVRADPVLSI